MSRRLELTLDTIAQLKGGVVAAQFQQLLEQAIADCKDRHELDKSREVTLTIMLSPDQRSKDNDVNVDFKFGLKIPNFQSPVFSMHLDFEKNERRHRITFNDSTIDGKADMYEGKDKPADGGDSSKKGE